MAVTPDQRSLDALVPSRKRAALPRLSSALCDARTPTAPGAPDAYLRRVVVNEYVSHVRAPRRLFRALQKVRPSTEVADASGPLADRAAMWQALGVLPPKQRAVLVLRYYEDLSDEEIADVLHCRATTVRSNDSRALRSLREAADGRTKEANHSRQPLNPPTTTSGDTSQARRPALGCRYPARRGLS